VKAVIVIPTYNESDNIAELINDIGKLHIDCDILVVDDSSPDGTAHIVREIAERNPRVHVMIRSHDKGRGYAGRDGFIKAIKMQPEFIIEMDADFSHNPKYIPSLLRECIHADVVIGSRAVPNGKEIGRGIARQVVTKCAQIIIRVLLNVPVRDCTSGYRCFKRSVLERIGVDSLISSGPSIVEEVLLRCSHIGVTFKEIPIIFEDRKKGQSNLTPIKLLHTLWMIIIFRFGGKSKNVS